MHNGVFKEVLTDTFKSYKINIREEEDPLDSMGVNMREAGRADNVGPISQGGPNPMLKKFKRLLGKPYIVESKEGRKRPTRQNSDHENHIFF